MDGAQGVERRFAGIGYNLGNGGFSNAGRSPENKRGYVAALNHPSYYCPGPHEVLLAYVIVDSLWAQALG